MGETHSVTNQPPPLADYDLFSTDPALIGAVKAEGAGWAADDLKAYCIDRGPLYSHPRHIAVVPALPLNGAGKIDRAVVQARLAAAWAAHQNRL